MKAILKTTFVSIHKFTILDIHLFTHLPKVEIHQALISKFSLLVEFCQKWSFKTGDLIFDELLPLKFLLVIKPAEAVSLYLGPAPCFEAL